MATALDEDTIRKETESRPKKGGTSELAAVRLLDELATYRAELQSEAMEIATREDVDGISVRHIKMAADRLRHPTRERSTTLATTFGGVLLGLGLSIAVQLLRGPLAPYETIVALIAFTLAGALLNPWSLHT